MMKTHILALVPLMLLSACAAQGDLQPAPPPTPKQPKGKLPPPITSLPQRPTSGLDRVIGKDARALVSLFGQPIQDVREPGARKLQFGGAGCILDAYLYPPATGREPVTKYVDARLPDGRDTDRAACIMTLSRGR